MQILNVSIDLGCEINTITTNLHNDILVRRQDKTNSVSHSLIEWSKSVILRHCVVPVTRENPVVVGDGQYLLELAVDILQSLCYIDWGICCRNN